MLGSQHSLYPGEHSLASALQHCYTKHFVLILANFTKISVQCTVCTVVIDLVECTNKGYTGDESHDQYIRGNIIQKTYSPKK